MSYAVDVLVDRICNWKADQKPLWSAKDPKGHTWWLEQLATDPKAALALDVTTVKPPHAGGPASAPLGEILADACLVGASTGLAWRAIRDRLRQYIDHVYDHGFEEGFAAGAAWARANDPQASLPTNPRETAGTPRGVHDSY